MARPVMALAVALGVSRMAWAAASPSVSDFMGTWRLAAVIGASDGGVTGTDPKALIGQRVRWTATDIVSPEGDCRLRHPTVSPMANRALETSIWGGQRIGELKLSKTEIAEAFGPHETPVFQDDAKGCANAVLIGRAHMVHAFGSGWIYRLDRVSAGGGDVGASWDVAKDGCGPCAMV